jgi:hypothetical protein
MSLACCRFLGYLRLVLHWDMGLNTPSETIYGLYKAEVTLGGHGRTESGELAPWN